MIIGIGNDLCDIRRIEKTLDRFGQRFIQRVFTDVEQKISDNIRDLNHKISGLMKKLKNKSFLKNAPKQIVEKEKKALLDYKIELKKLNSIANSIKN